MKFLLALAIALSSYNSAFAQDGHVHVSDRPAVHGMLMFGQSKIYLSHLPMFHNPHDYQAILEVEISAEGKAAYERSLKASDEKVYTLVPESFVLPTMIKNPTAFKAQIYKGHFEREGDLIADKVAVEIKKIVYVKKFNPKEVKPQTGNYILFGNEKEQFLAHSITVKPDFDQIIKIKPVGQLKSNPLLIDLKSIDNKTALKAPATYKTEDLSLEATSVIYLETGDLSF